MRRKYIGLLILIISLFNATLLTISATSEDMSDERYINQIEGTSSLDKDGNVVYHSNEELEETFSSEDIQLFSNEKISDYAVVNFRTKSSAGINTYYNEIKTGASGYLNGYYGADGAFLGYSSDGRVKFKSAGVVGLVDASDVELINYSNNLSVSCYWAENGRLYHYVAQNIKQSNSYFSINYVGKKPNYLSNNVTYYSYDGHYFYTDYKKMIDDYKNDGNGLSINASSPYYNYYQFLPYRSKTSFTANDFNSYTSHNVNKGKLLNLGSSFVENQNIYGVNGALTYGTAVMESGWGTSQIAMEKNNLFGHGAVDDNPYWGANGYSSPNESVLYHAKVFISEGYCDPLDYGGRYFGSHLGDKESGVNVKYASDPYWGEKIASICWYLEDYTGKKDSNVYTLGIKDDAKNVGVYTNPNSNLLYRTNVYKGYPFIILSEQNGYLKVQSDPTLSADRTRIIQDSGEYSFSNNYGYINKNDVTFVINGSNNNPKYQWYQDKDGNWYWYNGFGELVTGWQQIDKKWYYFNSNCIMQVGWLNLGGSWYYLDSSGEMITGLKTISGKDYYFNGSGLMQTGWASIKGKDYYFDGTGAMVKDTWIGDYYVDETGAWVPNKVKPTWIKDNTGWWYRHEDGSYTTNDFEVIDGKTYYFNASGYMVTGWDYIENKWYYFDTSGAMRTNWILLGNTWYYMESDGNMVTGKQTIQEKEYYFDASGAMKTGWIKLEGKDYYYNPDGALMKDTWIGDYYVDETGAWIPNKFKPIWIKDNTGWWYRHEDGSYTTKDFEVIDGKTYYFNASGYMVTGWQSINKSWYYFSSSGIMQTGWIKDGVSWYYCIPSGTMLTGLNKINGQDYYFNASGVMQTGWKIINNKYYYFYSSGAMAKNTWIDGYFVDKNGVWIP